MVNHPINKNPQIMVNIGKKLLCLMPSMPTITLEIPFTESNIRPGIINQTSATVDC